MTGKDILLIMICINLVYLIFAYGCATESVGYCPEVQNGIIGYLFNLDENTNFASSSGAQLTDDFNNQIGSVTQGQSGGGETGNEFGFGVLLDGLKMVLGVISLLTPIPILDMLGSLGVPLFITVFISVPVVAIYTINVIELIRGASFGSK